MRPDAEEILRLVLSRLDEMKAEDTLTIDLRDKSSIGDYMVVSSGRSQRHVGSVADRIVEDLHKAGVAALRLGADRRERRGRPRLSPGSARLLQSREDVDGEPAGAARQLTCSAYSRASGDSAGKRALWISRVSVFAGTGGV
jgi:Ribosomal silencing factor during starvation